MATIYSDEARTLDVADGYLHISSNKAGQHSEKSGRLEGLGTDDALPGDVKTALRKMGEDPKGWYMLRFGNGNGCPLACMPSCTRPAVETAIRENHEATVAARKAAQSDPAIVERTRIHRMFSRAEGRRDYPGEYFPLLMDAEEALKAWRQRYPGEAKQERISELQGDIADLESKASGALVYDADGSLSREMQDQRASEFRGKAAEKLAEIARLRSS